MPSPDPERHAPAPRRYIFLACPWTPKGGGMFKVADYLIQSQAGSAGDDAVLRPLDTRGSGSALGSLAVLVQALGRLLQGRLRGEVAGVHVNMAERLSLFRKSVLVLWCRLLGLPVLLHLHAAQLHHFYAGLPAPLQWLTRWIFSLPQAAVVLGQASHSFVTQTLCVPPARVSVLMNGVPEPTPPRRAPPGDGVRRILFVGNLSERKGVSDLLAALLMPGFDRQRTEVCFAGGGDLAAYRARVHSLGLDGWVHLAGWAEQSQVAELMARADVLVLPSYDEGLPLVILEALARGLAVVCTPVGEIPSVLHHGVHALFVQPGDVRGLAQTLQQVLGDAALRQRLGANGRSLYEAEMSMQHFFASVAQLHQRYFGLAATSRAPSCAVEPSDRPKPDAALPALPARPSLQGAQP